MDEWKDIGGIVVQDGWLLGEGWINVGWLSGEGWMDVGWLSGAGWMA